MEKEKDKALAVFKESEEAIQAASKLLEGFERIYDDPEARARATGSAGVVLGGSLNYLIDAMHETDEDRRAELKERGGIVLSEIGVACLKTLIAGSRRRRGVMHKK